MSEDKLYELRKDAWTPSGFWRAGIKHTQAEWQKEFNDPNLTMWNDWFIKESIENEPALRDRLYKLVNDVFEKKGLYSISYKEAACEVAQIWLKQNQKP